MQEQLKILTCGSVDDGKSTLIGHLLYDSKLLYTDQEKTLKLDSKINNNGVIDYSLLLDGLDEEREQKITIDIAYRYFNTKKRSFIILDAPGHEQYTKNMAVGASQADMALLLLDVTKGILIQTKRHLKICMMMGIKDYVVVANKMDLINYEEKKFNEIKKEINKLFKKYDNVSLKIIPISATKGDCIINSSNNMPWYKDCSLMQYLESIKTNGKDIKEFIMPIQRVSRPNQYFRGFQGTISSGKINVGDDIITYPNKETAKVKEIFNLDKKVKTAFKNQSITITLDREIDISRGCVLSNSDCISVTRNINVTMLWMDNDELKVNNAYYLNIGTTNTLCYVRKINYKLDIDNDEKITNFDKVTKNELINCDLEILEKVSVTKFSFCKNLGALILINRLTNATSACAIINEVLNDNNLFSQKTEITPDYRSKSLFQNPITIWFTGLSCSGKSTIANELDKLLNENGYHTILLDGDNIRLGLNYDLGFSYEDRIENIRRIAEVSKLMNDAGLICITSFISPLDINRKMAKKIIGDKFFLVYINTPIKICEKRDKKGLYKKARKGIIKDFTGVSSEYEVPNDCDICLNNVDYNECAKEIYNKIIERIKI